MKASLNWLRRLVDLPEAPQEIADRLTAVGLEVEEITTVFELPGVVVGEVREAEPVEGTHLSRCVVFDGTRELPIVCGAPNVRAGLKTALATVGAVLPGGLEIRAAKVHGMESQGMLCAEDELGLGEVHAGILELSQDLVVGESFSRAIGAADVVFEVNVTPNRPDATGHLGLARELSASFGRPLRNPLDGALPLDGAASVRKVSVEAGCGCTRYVGRTLRGLRNGASPEWMRNLLRAVGLRPISALVDVTNFVLMEIGQPLHAFDLSKVDGELTVRGAREGESLVTLDGQEHKLQVGDLVVADSRGPQCLGGVMGGEGSGVDDATVEIFLETAYFVPSVVRKLARRHGMGSDSSYRFERGVDPQATRKVSDYAARLIMELCGGAADAAQDLRLEGHPETPTVITTSPEKIAWRLGVTVDADKIRQILAPLGFVEQPASEGTLAFAVPSWRPDVREAAGLSEEIARRLGDAGIPPSEPVYPVTATRLPPRERWTRRLRRALASRGLHETLSLRFVGRKDHARMGFASDDSRGELVELANPLSDDWAALPRLGVVNLLRAAVRNENRQEKGVALFECLRVFGRDLPEAFAAHRSIGIGERNVLSGVLSGVFLRKGWGEGEAVDFYAAKGVLQGALRELGLEPEFVPSAQEPWLHPGRAATVVVEGRSVGAFGQLHPRVQEAWELRLTSFAWEIDIDALVEILESHPFAQVKAPSEFSATRREINAVVATSFLAGDLLAKVRALPQAGAPLLREVGLVDVYQGEGVPDGHKAMLLRFWYQAPDRTLTDAQVNEVHNGLREAVAALEGVSLK